MLKNTASLPPVLKLWIVFQCVGFGFPAELAHPVHVSLTEVTYISEREELQFAIRIFSDDLDDALKQSTGIRYFLSTPQQRPGAEDALRAYLMRSLRCLHPVQGDLTLEWVGMEPGLDATWCYLRGDGVTSFQELTIENRLIFNLYDDQTNVIHVHVDNRIRSARTLPANPVAFFRWK